MNHGGWHIGRIFIPNPEHSIRVRQVSFSVSSNRKNRSIFCGRTDDNSLCRRGRGNESQSGMIFGALGIESAKAPDFRAVLEVVGDRVVAAVR